MNHLNAVSEALNGHSVRYQFYYEEFPSGQSFASGEVGPFPFASIYKIAILGTLLESLHSEKDLEELISVAPTDVTPLASGVMNHLSLPAAFSVENLIRLMMVYSDGAATDLLQRRVGTNAINEFLKEIAPNSKITHDIRGLIQRIISPTFKEGIETTRKSYYEAIQEFTVNEDYTTAADVVSLLKYLHSKGPIHQRFLLVEPAYARTGAYCPSRVRIVGKTGTLGFFASMNDCGFVMKDGRPQAVFAILTQGWKSPRYLIEHAFGEIGRVLCQPFLEDTYSATYANERK